ncbi:hypothetical protein RRSWK_04242 [Rhodopirellula sp. SWK7]|nr:hypothetical protein RRSWK_04242 [Rhodopirellula sp. SWK7]
MPGDVSAFASNGCGRLFGTPFKMHLITQAGAMALITGDQDNRISELK